MKPKVYVETTVISYLTARSGRDLIMAAHQQITREWWEKCPDAFELVTSPVVIQEASAGDAAAARDRLSALAGLPLLDISDVALALVEDLLRTGALPEKARVDALHIAVAVTNGVDYLVTWNCKHMANATLYRKIEACCRAAGFNPVVICTPDELLGE
jgi:predicted nucleic acid-binding protein